MACLQELWCDKTGIATLETAILLALVALAAVSSWSSLGNVIGSSAAENTTLLEMAGG